MRRLTAFLSQPQYRAVSLYRLARRLHLRGHDSAALLLTALSRVVFSIEIEPGAVIGRDVTIRHGFGLVIGRGARIGDRCTLFHQVTLGASNSDDLSYPTVGDDVIIYAGAKLLGPITIGDGAVIGANAVVLCDVPAGHTAVGVPAVVRATAGRP